MIDDDLLQEMTEFLRIPVDVLRKRYEAESGSNGLVKWTAVTEGEWKRLKIDQKDPEAVAAFYRQTDNYIMELAEYNSTNYKKSLTAEAIRIIKKNGGTRVLDFGAGIGQDSISQTEVGLVAVAADLPGKTFDFAKWRFRKRGLEIEAIDLCPVNTSLKGMFDAITCFEVMQHLTDTVGTLKKFYEHLNPGGLLMMTYRFVGNYALALRKNEKYEGNFRGVVEDEDFKLKDKVEFWRPEDNRTKVLEVYKK